MTLCSIKIFNPNPFSVKIVVCDPHNNESCVEMFVGAGQILDADFSQGDELYYIRLVPDNLPDYIGKIYFNNQTFVMPLMQRFLIEAINGHIF